MYCFRTNHSAVVFALLLSVSIVHCEPITLTLAAGAIFGGWYKWNTIKENTICRFAECCIDEYVPYDMNQLKLNLSEKMFGQPLVNELVSIIRAHKSGFDQPDSNKKALVISLHGWTGVGKNYAATMIANALYKKGMQSNYVKLFMGKKDFDCTDLETRREKLWNDLRSVVRSCPKSLFIFDEIHDMCPNVLDIIKPMVDVHHLVDGVDYRDSVFIFISNIGSQEIADNLINLYSQGLKRTDVEFRDFEAVIRRTSYYKGGFEKADLIARHLIDHYIPFLPLEQQHVERCALTEFRLNGVLDPSPEMMADAMSVITYGPTEAQPIFANSGCKRFIKHIPYIIKKHQAKVLNDGKQEL